MFGSSGPDEGSKKRRLVIKELINTERTYLRDLSVLKVITAGANLVVLNSDHVRILPMRALI